MLNKYVHSTLLRRKITKLEIMYTVWYFYLKKKRRIKRRKRKHLVELQVIWVFSFFCFILLFQWLFTFYYFWLIYSINFYYVCMRVCVVYMSTCRMCHMHVSMPQHTWQSEDSFQSQLSASSMCSWGDTQVARLDSRDFINRIISTF